MARLAEIVGHETSLGALSRSLAAGRLPHSLIFHGPEGVGKRSAAIALAAALNCPKGIHGDACGACPSCLKIAKGVHPDLAFITLEKTVVPIEAIRRLRQTAAARPFEGRRRVFIIDPADRMSLEAQNALLKTLEEPSASCCIVLVTSRLMHLLPTTRSRCRAVGFGTLPPPALAEHLARLHGFATKRAQRAARLSGGRFGIALTLDLEEHDAAREKILEVLDRLSRPIPRDHVLKDVEAFGDDAEAIASRLEILRGLVRDMMLIRSGAPATSLVHDDVASALADLSLRLAKLPDEILERISLAGSDLDRSVNRRLLVETLMFDIAQEAAPPS